MISQYKSALNLYLLYVNISLYMNIYPIIQFDICIYIYIYIIIFIYIYIYMYKNFVFCLFVYCNIVAAHTHTGHTGFTFTQPIPAGFTWSLLLVETVYQIVNTILVINKKPEQLFLVFMVKFWQVLSVTLKSSYRRCSIKKSCS